VWLGTTIESPNAEMDVQGAWRDIERALQLQPELPEALAARASYLTYVEREPMRALRDLDRALELAPNDADTHGIAGLTKRRLGRFDEAIAHFREAARLMPAQPQHSLRVFETLEGLGRLAEAEQERKAFAQRFPDWRAPAELSGFHVRFLATGATDGWQEAYERLAPGLSPAIRSYFFGRLCLATGDFAGYAAFLEAADRSEFESASNRVVELGRATAALGDRARARPYLQSVVDETRAPDGVPLTDGAVALALLGRPDEAVRAADEAIRLVPESRDAVNGPTVAVQRAANGPTKAMQSCSACWERFGCNRVPSRHTRSA